jgi:hypothetical protein
MVMCSDMPGMARLIAEVTPSSAGDVVSAPMVMPGISGIAPVAARAVSVACARPHEAATEIRSRVRIWVRMRGETCACGSC